MQGLKDKIHSISEKHESFGYYELLIEKAERNAQVNPDICIEACKSLIEGVSKQIQKSFDPQITERDFKGRNVELQNIFGWALDCLAEHNEEFEDDLMRKMCMIVKIIGEIRNDRGDISHGKLIPKPGYSNKFLALLICQFTEAIVMYMLNVFDTIDLSFQEETPYEENETYNEWLDDDNPLEGISYSQALYDQDYDAYLEGLENFKQEEDMQLLEDNAE